MMVAKNDTGVLTCEVESTDETDSKVIVHIRVEEDGEWAGDFFATFEQNYLRRDGSYVADWSSTAKGNGVYAESEPPFWPVQEVAEKLNHTQADKEFVAINSGPTDK